MRLCTTGSEAGVVLVSEIEAGVRLVDVVIVVSWIVRRVGLSIEKLVVLPVFVSSFISYQLKHTRQLSNNLPI